jgi:hypothetical protein
MTRVEWMRGLDRGLREKIISRIVDGNDNVDFIDQWMQSEVDIKKEGIKGAFTWSTTPEGLTYWDRINTNIK